MEQTALQATGYVRTRDMLVTLGIQPIYLATEYGHIECGPADLASKAATLHQVKLLVEKPISEMSAAILHSGTYLWNNGMFVWQMESILSAFMRHTPELSRRMIQAVGLRWLYPELPKISGDYIVLKRADNVVVEWHVGLDVGGAILYTTSGEDLMATIELDTAALMPSDDVTLIVREDLTQHIKKVVQQLKLNHELEYCV